MSLVSHVVQNKTIIYECKAGINKLSRNLVAILIFEEPTGDRKQISLTEPKKIRLCLTKIQSQR